MECLLSPRPGKEKVTTEELLLYRNDFDKYDTDGNGTLSVDELEGLLKDQLQRQPTEDETQCLLEQLDGNNDGAVNFREYLGVVFPDGFIPPPPPFNSDIQTAGGYIQFGDKMLGKGGMGAAGIGSISSGPAPLGSTQVWDGMYWDGIAQEKVALKVVPNVSSIKTSEEWAREAKIVSLLSKHSNPHIIKYYDACTAERPLNLPSGKMRCGDGVIVMEKAKPIKYEVRHIPDLPCGISCWPQVPAVIAELKEQIREVTLQKAELGDELWDLTGAVTSDEVQAMKVCACLPGPSLAFSFIDWISLVDFSLPSLS